MVYAREKNANRDAICPINLAGGAFSIPLLFNINHKYLIVILKKVLT